MAFCELPAEACGAFGDATSAGAAPLNNQEHRSLPIKNQSALPSMVLCVLMLINDEDNGKKKKRLRRPRTVAYFHPSKPSANSSGVPFWIIHRLISRCSGQLPLTGLKFQAVLLEVALLLHDRLMKQSFILDARGTWEVTDLSVELTWFRLQLFPSVRVRMCFLSSS